MNKIFKTMMLAAITAFGMASCEDVPAPFVEPEQPGTGGSEEITLPYTSANLKEGFEVHTTAGMAWSLGNTYAKATGYNSGSTTASQTYLISPAIPLGDAKNVYVDFDYVIAYTNSLGLEEGHKVLVCSEYNSADPTQSDWITLPFQPKEREDRNSWDMYPANTMSIPANFLGKTIRVAFLYNCNSNSASTWELTNLSVSTEPGGEVTPDEPDTPSEGGTWDKPYTVAEAITNQTGEEVWVHAYIVGSIPEGSSIVLENMTFTADGANHTNLCIADTPDETNYANCAPVQLPSGSDARTNLNLKNNPTMLGKEVWLKGKTTKYCGAPGLKEVSKYTLTKPTAADDENAGDTPAEGAKGDGSLENPFNAAGAHNFTAALTADQATTEKFYIKGIVCESNKMDISVQYKNATFHISDDGTTNGAHFLIFRTKGLNGADITSEDDVKVGDEVVVYAQLINYKGNTPETNQGGIIYSQKRNGQDMGGNGEEDTPGGNEQGNGTLENPYNVASVLGLYETGNPEGQNVYVKGKISQIKSLDVSKWERAQYFISDDGTENGQFQIYNGYYLGGKPFTSNDQIKVGDEVIVYGELSSYKGTPQIAQNSKIVSINGQTEDNDTPGEDDNENEDIPTEGNILKNGDFELWEGGLPTNWKSASTAGNVELTQSTEAHGGTYAVSLGYVESSNKRMAYKETTLPAGTYKFSFYAKGTDTTEGSLCQTRPGYVPMKADGSADSSNYKYGDYASLSATEWTLVEHEFTLAEETTLCLVIMSPKGTKYHTSQNILVDDASLVKVN